MNIAIIDDQSDIRHAIEKILVKDGHTCYQFEGHEDELLDALKVFNMDLVILDMMLKNDLSGLDVLRRIRDASFDIPIIMITAYTTPSNLIEASKAGIIDIIEKPFSGKEILEIIHKYKKASKEENHISLHDGKEEFIGSFETMKDIYKQIGIAVKSNLNVLICGQAGTGKERVAKLIHQNSGHSAHPFIAINCAAIPEDMFDNLMFGCKEGFFTGADSEHIGYAQAVGDGTLFLDEISELIPSLQIKLLRFVESKTFYQIGSSKESKFTGKIICASVNSPKKLIEKGAFRNDLYYQISSIEIDVPNLELRQKDIKALSMHFINLANQELGFFVKSIDDDAITFLKNINLRGNIRELKNIIYKTVLNVRNEKISLEDIKSIFHLENENPDFQLGAVCANIVNMYGVQNAKQLFEDIEKNILKELLVECPNVSKLSKYLDISRNTLKSKIDKFI